MGAQMLPGMARRIARRTSVALDFTCMSLAHAVARPELRPVPTAGTEVMSYSKH